MFTPSCGGIQKFCKHQRNHLDPSTDTWAMVKLLGRLRTLATAKA